MSKYKDTLVQELYNGREPEDSIEFLHELVRCAENMSVILGNCAYSGQSVQDSG